MADHIVHHLRRPVAVKADLRVAVILIKTADHFGQETKCKDRHGADLKKAELLILDMKSCLLQVLQADIGPLYLLIKEPGFWRRL